MHGGVRGALVQLVAVGPDAVMVTSLPARRMAWSGLVGIPLVLAGCGK